MRTLSYPREPLDQPIAGLVEPSNVGRGESASNKDFLSNSRITTLGNGLRVASQEGFGQYSTIGGEDGK